MIFNTEKQTHIEPTPSALYRPFATESHSNDWTIVNGVAAAKTYKDVETEYSALTNGTGLVDLGIQMRYAIRGIGSSALLGRLTSAPLNDMKLSESGRGLILNSDGYVVDFCNVTRLSGDSFLLTTSTPIDRRLNVASRGFDVSIENISETVAALGLFGPYATKTAAAAGFAVSGDTLASHGRVRGVEAFARPTALGRTSGIEIIFPADEALTLWERIRKNDDLVAVGLSAFDILRIESGHARPGLDFDPADSASLGTRRLPAEINAPHLAPLNRAWFNGRRAIADAKPERQLVTLVADADHIDPGTPIYDRISVSGRNQAGNSIIGRVTSSAYSPHFRAAVCVADVPLNDKKRGAFMIGMNIKTRLLETPESKAASAFEEHKKKPTESKSFFV